ncbi:MAG TPA: PepSY domain-containing protein [Methylophilaceae bacterium]|jgi:uncharacterized membrane protein YkoI|nr:PepSY domain-containing protein [Methylophilaceae bacterium]
MTHKLLTIGLAAALAAITSAAHAAPTALDNCVKAALDKHPGKLASLSSEIEDGKSQYEIDIQGQDGFGWEAECDAATGKINRIEREIRANAKEFKSKAKVRLDAAMKIALDKYPGDVLNTEYDMENDGEISYEFVIRTSPGKTVEIEVDAVTGKLAGEEEVLYRIGN